MSSNARHSPARRGISDINLRIERLRAYEAWHPIEPIAFEQIVGADEYRHYWELMDQSINFLRDCQVVADVPKRKISAFHGQSSRTGLDSLTAPIDSEP